MASIYRSTAKPRCLKVNKVSIGAAHEK